MKPLLKVIGLLLLVFVSLFILGRLLGVFTLDAVKELLAWANSVDPWVLAGIIILLLVIDLLISVPTLIVTISAGYFLGFFAGSITALTGLLSSVLIGYYSSRLWGTKVLRLVVRSTNERKDLRSSFARNGPVMIILARALPMLPEVTACLAGATRMPLLKFVFLVSLGAIPYTLIASFAGSISSFENPQPAIYAMIIFYMMSWSAWGCFQLYQRSVNRKFAVKATSSS